MPSWQELLPPNSNRYLARYLSIHDAGQRGLTGKAVLIRPTGEEVRGPVLHRMFVAGSNVRKKVQCDWQQLTHVSDGLRLRHLLEPDESDLDRCWLM